MPAAFANANVIGYTKYAHAFLRELRCASPLSSGTPRGPGGIPVKGRVLKSVREY